MDRQVLAIDFDDVLLPFNREFSLFHNEKHGTKVGYEDISSYDMSLVYGCSHETVIERVKQFYHSAQHAQANPVQGAVEALRRLATRCVFDIVTSRAEEFHTCTHAYLDRFFREIFRSVHFTNGFGAGEGARTRSKSEICREIGAVALVDDALSHAEEVARSGIPVLLPDRPWNRSCTPPGVIRVNSWDDITAWIENR